MGKLFNSLGHFFAWLLHVGLPAATKDTKFGAAVGGAVAAAVAGIIGQDGAQAQATVEALAGSVLQAISDAGGVIAADGLNVKLDEAIVADVKDLYAQIAGIFHPAPPKAS